MTFLTIFREIRTFPNLLMSFFRENRPSAPQHPSSFVASSFVIPPPAALPPPPLSRTITLRTAHSSARQETSPSLMSNTPNNPFDPPPQDKGPWLYSGAPTPPPQYIPPTAPAAPHTSASPKRPKPPKPPSPPPPPTYPPLPKATWSFSSKPPDPQKTQPEDNSLASIVDTIRSHHRRAHPRTHLPARFIVEAFVIPTGSMAPTLLGAHFDVICPKCGYIFTRDASLHYQLETNPRDGSQHVAYLGNRAELHLQPHHPRRQRTAPPSSPRFPTANTRSPTKPPPNTSAPSPPPTTASPASNAPSPSPGPTTATASSS